MAGPSVGGKHFIQGAIAQDLRTDGRKRLVYRPISVETGVIPQANGSARVRTGTTDVIASVKRNFLLIFPNNHHWEAELGKPYLLQPGKGRVIINVDCSPAEASVFKAEEVKSYQRNSQLHCRDAYWVVQLEQVRLSVIQLHRRDVYWVVKVEQGLALTAHL